MPRHRLPAVVPFLVVGALAACAGPAGPPAVARSYAGIPKAIEPTANVMVAHPRQPVTVEGSQPSSADLMGFAARLKLRWSKTTDQLDSTATRLLQLDNPRPNAPLPAASVKPTAPLKAPAGRELVVVQLDSWTIDKAGRRPWDKQTSDARMTISIGAESAPIPQAADVLDVIIVSAPKGAPVVAKLTEYGKTQSVDLRTGKLGPDALPEMTGPRDLETPLDYDAGGNVTDHGVTRPFTAHVYTAKGEMQPHLQAAGGWAPPGRSWMLISVGLSTDGFPKQGDPPNWFFVDYVLDTAKSFTVVLPDGQRLTPKVAEKIDTKLDPSTGKLAGSTEIIFDVPANTTTGTLHTVVTGEMKAVWANGTFNARWGKAPAATDSKITITPL